MHAAISSLTLLLLAAAPEPKSAAIPATLVDEIDGLVGQQFFSPALMEKAGWNNTRLLKGDLATEVRKLKSESGNGMCILGSGTIVAQLADAGLIDEFHSVTVPVVPFSVTVFPATVAGPLTRL